MIRLVFILDIELMRRHLAASRPYALSPVTPVE